MSRTHLPNDSHVVRYVRPGLIDSGAIEGSAFIRRDRDCGLSVNWLEAFGTDSDDKVQLQQVRRLFRLKLSRNGRFAKLRVGDTKEFLSARAEEAGISLVLGMVSAPLPPEDKFEADPSHSEITGVPPSDSDEAIVIGDLISECVTYPLYPGKVE